MISTERSVVERPAVLVPWTLLRATTAVPFVISTGAQRSGEICGFLPIATLLRHFDWEHAALKLKERLCAKHFQEEDRWTADLSTTLRSGRDDKGEGGASREKSC
jgi:hypothetical protein